MTKPQPRCLMKKTAFMLKLLVISFACQPASEEGESAETAMDFSDEVRFELEDNLLKVWYPRTIDTTMGGFLSNFTHDWQQMDNQEKMIVTQARHVWTLSKAARLYPEEQLYKDAARHGYEFLRNKMWDQEHGGFYWLVDRSGEPMMQGVSNQLKRVYGNAFGIYALAAYYEMSEDEEVLDFARQAFQWMDEHAHDSEGLGYYPTLTREGEVIDSSMFEQQFPPQDYFYKDQNTSIHVLEALTELYHVWPDDTLEARLKEMFHLVRDTMVSEKGYLRLFFYNNWLPVSYLDSAQTVREANYGIDHVSFGHDIETAYLLLEASEALEEYEYKQTLDKAKQMVDHTITTGFDPENSGILERGYYLPGEEEITILDDRKNWWSQAEGLNSLYLFSTFYPDDSVYKQEFEKLWNYTKNNVIDHEYGDWYSYGLDTHPSSREDRKAQIWKGNYHNARALFNLLKMAQEGAN